jgi:hypothetical protein
MRDLMMQLARGMPVLRIDRLDGDVRSRVATGQQVAVTSLFGYIDDDGWNKRKASPIILSSDSLHMALSIR